MPLYSLIIEFFSLSMNVLGHCHTKFGDAGYQSHAPVFYLLQDFIPCFEKSPGGFRKFPSVPQKHLERFVNFHLQENLNMGRMKWNGN